MKLLVDAFWTLVFFTDREVGDTRPPVLLLVAVVVATVVLLLVAWHGITRAILQVAPWAGLYLHWWFIPLLLVVGLAFGQAGRR
jgi:hypothetical protein